MIPKDSPFYDLDPWGVVGITHECIVWIGAELQQEMDYVGVYLGREHGI